MKHLLTTLAVLLAALPALAADGDFVGAESAAGVSTYILCDAVATGADCSNFDMSKFGSTPIGAIAVSIVSETGTPGCTVLPKGRNSAAGTAVDLTTGTLTAAGTAEESYESWWKYVYATIGGGCTTATVYLKVKEDR